MQKIQTYSFEAEPKVVRQKQKYKNEDLNNQNLKIIDTSQNILTSNQKSGAALTFENLMADKRIKLLNPIQQEQEYVRLERERIKIENIHTQLVNFKKVKKKITPYDIKPSPNPRIEVNLEFFLTDPNNQAPQTHNIEIQTDFFEKKPPSPKYIPKKTGIEAGTQVENYELFDFDKEVTPIIDVIVSKTLEQSSLEVEEEEQIDKMLKFKREYYQRRSSEQKKWKGVLDKEKLKAKQKDQMLALYRRKDDLKIEAFQRVQTYNISKGYLLNLKNNTFTMLLQNGLWQNDLNNQINTKLVDWLIDTVTQEFNKLTIYKQQNVEMIQDLNVGFQLQQQRYANDRKIQNIKLKKQQRRFNLDNKDFKMIRIYYSNPQESNSTPFARYLNKFLDGSLTEYLKQMDDRLNEIKSKLENNEISEEEYHNIKNLEFPLTPQNYFGFNVSNLFPLSLNIAHNKYYDTLPKEKRISISAQLYNQEGQLIQKFDKINQSNYSSYEMVRDNNLKISDDEALSIDFQQIPQNVEIVLFYITIKGIQQSQAPKDLQYSRYSLSDSKYNVILHEQDIFNSFKIEEMIRPPQEDQDNDSAQKEQNLFIFTHLIQKDPLTNDWKIEVLNMGKVLFPNEENDFFNFKLYEYVQKQTQQFISDQQSKIKQKNRAIEEAERLYQEQLEQAQRNQEKILEKQQKSKKEKSKKGQQKEDEQLFDDELTLQQEPPQLVLPQPQFQNTCFQLQEIDLNMDIEQIYKQLSSQIYQENQSLIENAKWGYEFYVHNNLLVKSSQLRKVRKLGDLELRKKDEPIKTQEEVLQTEENQIEIENQ